MKDKDRDPQTYAIIGAAMEVHRELGRGFLEAVYQEAFSIELYRRGIPFDREVDLSIRYKSQVLITKYRADFVVFGDVVVELKTQAALTGIDSGQVLNYLKTSGIRRGLLLNFGTNSLETKRLIL